MPGKHNKPSGYQMINSALKAKVSPMKALPALLLPAVTTGLRVVGTRAMVRYGPQIVKGGKKLIKNIGKGKGKGKQKFDKFEDITSKSNLTSQLTKKKPLGKRIKDWTKKNPTKTTIIGAAAFTGVDAGVKAGKKWWQGKESAKEQVNKPVTPGTGKGTGRKTYKQAYADPKVASKYKDKGGYKQFVKEADAWWKTSAGQKYAKKNPQFKHRIIK